MERVGRNISNFVAGVEDISYLELVEPLTTFPIVYNTQLMQQARARRVTLLPLVKLSKYRQTSVDR